MNPTSETFTFPIGGLLQASENDDDASAERLNDEAFHTLFLDLEYAYPASDQSGKLSLEDVMGGEGLTCDLICSNAETASLMRDFVKQAYLSHRDEDGTGFVLSSKADVKVPEGGFRQVMVRTSGLAPGWTAYRFYDDQEYWIAPQELKAPPSTALSKQPIKNNTDVVESSERRTFKGDYGLIYHNRGRGPEDRYIFKIAHSQLPELFPSRRTFSKSTTSLSALLSDFASHTDHYSKDGHRYLTSSGTRRTPKDRYDPIIHEIRCSPDRPKISNRTGSFELIFTPGASGPEEVQLPKGDQSSADRAEGGRTTGSWWRWWGTNG